MVRTSDSQRENTDYNPLAVVSLHVATVTTLHVATVTMLHVATVISAVLIPEMVHM